MQYNPGKREVPDKNFFQHRQNPKLEKQEKLFKDIDALNAFDIIYFDAFGARVQPELWTESIFEIMYKAMKSNSVLVTYSDKGTYLNISDRQRFEE